MRNNEKRKFTAVNVRFDVRVFKILNNLSSKLQQDSSAFMRLIVSVFLDGSEGFKRNELILFIPDNFLLEHKKGVSLKLNSEQFDLLKTIAKKHDFQPGPFIRFLIELFCTNKKFRKRIIIGIDKIFSQIELLEAK